AESLRSIGGRISIAKHIGFRPARPEAADNGIDLLVCEHAAGTLSAGGHWGGGYPGCHKPPERCSNRKREKEGIGQRNRCSSFALRAVAPGTVVSVKDVEVH